MATPRALVLRAAGTNCDSETAYAFEACGAKAEVLPLLPFLERPQMLRDYQVLALPGGFSYGDDVLAGRVWGLEMIHRAGEAILDHVQGGGLVLGICNGFQVLVQMGLLPGLDAPLGTVECTLTDNEVPVYQDRWVHLTSCAEHCAFLRPGETYYVPIAHAEGKLVPLDDALRRRIADDGRVALRYVGPDGGENPAFPHNPNGSVDAIAGLTDATGRIFGLMPHPERHMFPYQHPTWTRDGLNDEPDGLRMFRHGVESLN